MRLHGVGVDDGRNGVRSVVKSVHKFETQRHEQRDTEENVGRNGSGVNGGEIGKKLEGGIDDPHQQHHCKGHHSHFPWTFVEFCFKCGRGSRHKFRSPWVSLSSESWARESVYPNVGGIVRQQCYGSVNSWGREVAYYCVVGSVLRVR